MKKVFITQSNYIPWKGYFDAIKQVDVVVLYDDMQYTRRDWRNRNLIKTNHGLHWLTIPVKVKGKYFQKIKDTVISDPTWNVRHWSTIKQFYSKAGHFIEYKDMFENAYLSSKRKYISEINYDFIVLIKDLLGIEADISLSWDFDLYGNKNERLISICKQLNATDYYTGPRAKSYMDETMFAKEDIRVHYLDYSGYPEYPQMYFPFEHAVSVIDLIFNTGKEFCNYMKLFNG